MTLKPKDEQHALQIQAGTLGRNSGHQFEDNLTSRINSLPIPYHSIGSLNPKTHLFVGSPELVVLGYIFARINTSTLSDVIALSTGALATSEAGKEWLVVNGVRVSKCKSDVLLTLRFNDGEDITIGISTKQCNNTTPTNAQLYFTTARGFCALLRNNGIEISMNAENALRQFCGDEGFRPLDNPSFLKNRRSDPRRFFWEEISNDGRLEWERVFNERQDEITRLLLQKAYLDDPFPPDFILHKTKRADCWETTEIGLYSVEELIDLSRNYSRFKLRPYSVRKGSFRDPEGVTHLAPRFGIVQMQRGGQAQHPTQLQFNLEAGYFYKI